MNRRDEERHGEGATRRFSAFPRLRVPASPHGFTLIELSIVIFIILIMTSATVPWMRTFAESTRLRTATRSIRSLMEFARNSAVTQRTEYVVLFDPDQREYWLSLMEFLDTESGVISDASRTSLSESLASLEERTSTNLSEDEEETMGSFSRTGGILGIPKELPGGIEIVLISSPRTAGEEATIEYIAFNSDGTAEDFDVYLQSSSGRVFLLSVEGVTGRTSIRELTDQEIEEFGLTIEI